MDKINLKNKNGIIEYEEFNYLGRRKQAMIVFALEKKHFLRNIKNIKRNK